ncbi:MAG: YraN family protein [Wolbachia sp.]
MINKLHCLIDYYGGLLALIYSKLKWYNVIKHRYCCRLDEVDFIASKKELIFIEVKTSSLGKETDIFSSM